MKINLTNKTFEQLVEANNFGYKYITNSYKPQEPKKGKVEIELWHPGKDTTNQEFLDHCKEVNGRPATFNEALQLALDNPDQKEVLVTYDLEQLCFLYLYFGGDERRLRVYHRSPGHYWRGGVRFLVVPAPVSVPASSLKLGDSELDISLNTWPLDTLTINGVEYARKNV